VMPMFVITRYTFSGSLIAKFHYTDTDTDPNGPHTDPTEFRRKKVRVSVRVGPVSVSV